jgi:hypothetical protein
MRQLCLFTERGNVAVKLQTSIWEVPASNLGRETSYPDGLRDFHDLDNDLFYCHVYMSVTIDGVPIGDSICHLYTHES